MDGPEMSLLRNICLAVLASAASVAAQAPELPAAADSLGGFALPDREGRRLLSTADLPHPERLRTALCGESGRVSVRFAGRQQAGAADSGRQTPENFDNLAGSVFRTASPVDPAESCFLASEALLARSTPLDVAPPAGAGACLDRRRLGEIRQRSVTRCWPLARLGPRAQAALLEFERRGTHALASIVIVDGPATLFADYPAEVSGAGQDVWRVDDGGRMSPRGWRIAGALRRGGTIALAVSWAGAEGQSLSLWTGSGPQLTQVLADYWYQSPL